MPIHLCKLFLSISNLNFLYVSTFFDFAYIYKLDRIHSSLYMNNLRINPVNHSFMNIYRFFVCLFELNKQNEILQIIIIISSKKRWKKHRHYHHHYHVMSGWWWWWWFGWWSSDWTDHYPSIYPLLKSSLTMYTLHSRIGSIVLFCWNNEKK